MNSKQTMQVFSRPKQWLCWAAVFLGIFFCQSILAQPADDYPKRPIRLIVSFAPGGGKLTPSDCFFIKNNKWSTWIKV